MIVLQSLEGGLCVVGSHHHHSVAVLVAHKGVHILHRNLGAGENLQPVSYTHLDVYKRQKEDYRNKGYGRELLSACEAWTKARGCHEFASDCEIENEKSFHFHKAMNFAEVNRIICFTKKL